MTTVRSRKAKGRRLQNWVRDTLLKIFSNNGFLDENDIKCAVMGETGADIKLSNTAKKIIAKSNSDKRETPIGIIKMNKQQPLAILDAEHFLKMIGKL
jgi:prophage antirepressor-like protein